MIDLTLEVPVRLKGRVVAHLIDLEVQVDVDREGFMKLVECPDVNDPTGPNLTITDAADDGSLIDAIWYAAQAELEARPWLVSEYVAAGIDEARTAALERKWEQATGR